MIPEQYWQLAKRWLWLIGAFAVLGAITGVLLLPSVVGSPAGFNSSATLAVSQQASLTSIPTSGDVEVDDTVVASYTESLVTYASSPQFISSVQEMLLLTGYDFKAAELEDILEVTANPTLFRVTVEASGDTEAAVTAVATAAVTELKVRAVEEELQLASTLIENLDSRAAELAAQLPRLQAEKADGPIDQQTRARVEAAVLNRELEVIAGQLQNLRLGQAFSLPLVTVQAPQTVAVEARSLSIRDFALLGIFGGLLAGWGAANVADGLTNKPKKAHVATRPTTSVVLTNSQASLSNGLADIYEAHEVDVRFGRITERTIQLERRMKVLDGFRASRNGATDKTTTPALPR